MTEIFDILEKKLEAIAEEDRKYPNRHRVIHKECCKRCPSDYARRHGIEDGESKDLKDGMTKEQLAKEVVFVCAWRTSKLCKGICDYFEIDQEYLNKLYTTT